MDVTVDVERLTALTEALRNAQAEVERLRKWLEAVQRDGDRDSQRMAIAALAGKE